MLLLAWTFNKATYSLSRNDLKTMTEQGIETGNLSALENKVYPNDIEFKKALKLHLGENEAKKHESEIIAHAIHMNSFLVLIGILGFVASFAVSLGPVMWVLFSELFPNRVRGLAVSFAGFINSGISFIVQFVFPWELANMGNSLTFLIYGIFAFLGLLFIITMIPETKGKSLEELEKSLIKVT